MGGRTDIIEKKQQSFQQAHETGETIVEFGCPMAAMTQGAKYQRKEMKSTESNALIQFHLKEFVVS